MSTSSPPVRPGSSAPLKASKPAFRRVKPCAARRLRRSLPGQGLTRLAGPLRPGRAQPRPTGDTMSPSTGNVRPTDRQINFLKSLAEQTGTSFTYPKTRREASSEIERLLQFKDSGHIDFPAMVEADERSLVYATAVADDEVSGYGSTATWSGAPVDDRLCDTEPRRIGERTELGRYSISSGERVIYGQRINGGVRITDRPAAGDGR